MDKPSVISLVKKSIGAPSAPPYNDAPGQDGADSASELPWHAVSAEAAVEDLASDADGGLSTDDARRRLSEFGPNRMTDVEKPGFFKRLWDKVRELSGLGARGLRSPTAGPTRGQASPSLCLTMTSLCAVGTPCHAAPSAAQRSTCAPNPASRKHNSCLTARRHAGKQAMERGAPAGTQVHRRHTRTSVAGRQVPMPLPLPKPNRRCPTPGCAYALR